MVHNLDFEHLWAGTSAGRCNPDGVKRLYLSVEKEIAQAEFEYYATQDGVDPDLAECYSFATKVKIGEDPGPDFQGGSQTSRYFSPRNRGRLERQATSAQSTAVDWLLGVEGLRQIFGHTISSSAAASGQKHRYIQRMSDTRRLRYSRQSEAD